MEKKRSENTHNYETEMHGQQVIVRVFSSPCEPTYSFEKTINAVLESPASDMPKLWDAAIDYRTRLTEWTALDKGLAGEITVVSTSAQTEQPSDVEGDDDVIPVDTQLKRGYND